jgi:hypothetical protein
MAWHRKGGRLVRRGLRSDVTPSELPRRRRRRVRPQPRHRHHLGSLPDDIAKRVFAFVAPSADPVAFLRILATDSAVRGLVNRCCLEHLNTCAVDAADGILLMRAFARARAPLRSLTIHLGSDEVPMLRWLLETCDTTNLARVRISVSRQVRSMLLSSEALVHGHPDADGIIDIETDAFEVPTMDDFRRIVAWTPDPTLRPAVSALRSLTLVSCADDVLRLFGASDGSCELPNVRTLRMTLPQARIRRVRDSERGTRFVPAEVNDFALLRRLPRLHTLHLNGCDYTRISIASPSLRLLDLSRAGKHCFIHSVACPMLTDLHVRDTGYGTGIRRVVPLTAEVAEEWNYDDLSRVGQPVIKWDEKSREYRWRAGEGAVSVPAAGNTWVAPHHEDLPTPSRRGYRFIFLPATCTVHFE